MSLLFGGGLGGEAVARGAGGAVMRVILTPSGRNVSRFRGMHTCAWVKPFPRGCSGYKPRHTVFRIQPNGLP